MKKVLLGLFSLMLIGTRVYAVSADDKAVDLKDYETLNFREVLKDEEIEEEFDNYKETDDQITIYMFRGKGCGYCRAFLTFLNSITNDYGKYFKLVGFEVWNNQENSELLDKISTFKGSAAEGVPYIIIGDNVFPGYASSYDDSIKAAIEEEYKSENRIDVFEDYNKAIKDAKKQTTGSSSTIIFWNFIFVLCATVVVLYFNNKNYKALMEKLSENKNSSAKKTNAKKN